MVGGMFKTTRGQTKRQTFRPAVREGHARVNVYIPPSKYNNNNNINFEIIFIVLWTIKNYLKKKKLHTYY